MPVSDDQAPSPLDHETRLQAHDHTALRLWLRLLTCTSLIEASVRQILRTDFESTLPRFDLLAQLDRHPQGLRMSELSQRLMVTGGNITALADQLEAEGLLRREPVTDDRRSIRLKLSSTGRKRFAEMAAGHERWVVSLFEVLSQDEQRQLLALLAKLKPGLAEGKRRAEELRAANGRTRAADAPRRTA
ncbi:MAG: MarR family transcriptional regulator [Burkholderiaceae bacterium]|nr:MarR family transcriptional regulator [Burkholderiaceae bacterium]